MSNGPLIPCRATRPGSAGSCGCRKVCRKVRYAPQGSSRAFRRSTEEGPEATRTRFVSGFSGSGETQIRTGDTTIFSRVLYQLSYLAKP